MFDSPLFINSSILNDQAAPYRSIAELLWVQHIDSFHLEEHESGCWEKQQ